MTLEQGAYEQNLVLTCDSLTALADTLGGDCTEVSTVLLLLNACLVAVHLVDISSTSVTLRTSQPCETGISHTHVLQTAINYCYR